VRTLIIGGTRFLGRRVAGMLAAAGHDLTLLSRRPGGAPQGVRQVCAERSEGLHVLHRQHFDLVLDFICYESTGPRDVAAILDSECYVMISSTWVPRLWSGIRADERGPGLGPPVANLPTVTLNYLCGKLRAEQAVADLHKSGRNAVSLRLPVMLGEGDHTGRLNFYRNRLADGGPLIAVDGGHNLVQIAVMEDLATAVVRWAVESEIGRFAVWEGLPGEGRSVRSILQQMANSAGVTPELVDVPATELAAGLPVYLQQEPFWREVALPVTEANIYAAVGMVPAVFGRMASLLTTADETDGSLRSEELRFLASRKSH